jgi:hypothetical protein
MGDASNAKQLISKKRFYYVWFYSSINPYPCI